VGSMVNWESGCHHVRGERARLGSQLAREYHIYIVQRMWLPIHHPPLHLHYWSRIDFTYPHRPTP